MVFVTAVAEPTLAPEDLQRITINLLCFFGYSVICTIGRTSVFAFVPKSVMTFERFVCNRKLLPSLNTCNSFKGLQFGQFRILVICVNYKLMSLLPDYVSKTLST